MLNPTTKAQQICTSILLVIFVLAISNAQAANKGFFWEVQGGKQPLYLLGSIHFATADFYPFADHVELAFSAANNLVVEVDISRLESKQLQSIITEMGTYRAPETLADHISASTLAKLKDYLLRNGLSYARFAQQKPGLIVMTITSLELAKQGLSANQGIDLYFLNKAGDSKTIIQLETIREQLSVLLADRYADSMLSQTLDETANYDQLVSELINFWREGDQDGLQHMLINEPLETYPESREAFAALFSKRNRQMVTKIEDFLAKETSHFVVVGAGHMLGEDGIVEQLRDRGFKVIRR